MGVSFLALFSIFVSFSITYYFVPILITLAKKFNITDKPNLTLKKHEAAIPYLGGLAVFLGFLISISMFLPFDNNIFLLLCGSFLLVILGLIDDLIDLSPFNKIIGQSFAVLCFLRGGLVLKESFLGNWINILISLFWFLYLINSFNLIDVMDGLSSTVALSASIMFLIFALIQGNVVAVVFVSSLIGALFAFFYFNKPPAKIYLGDSGSLFVGGILACFPFLISWSEVSSIGYLAPLLILFLPIYEVAALVFIRTWKGIPFFKGSRDHFSLYLLDRGISKYRILVIVVLASILMSILSFILYFSLLPFVFLLVIFVALLFLWLGIVFYL